MEVEMAAAESVSGDQSPYLHEETPHDGHTHTGTDSTKESTKDSEDQSSSQPQNADDTVYPHGLRLISTLTALILSVFLVSLDRTIIATAIPRITSEFNSLSQVGWYASAFFLTLASFQSTWGKCYKYFPMKLIFLLSIFLFELGSLVSGVAPNSTALIVGRAISGCGGAGIIAGAYILIALSGPPKKRPLYTGLIGAVYGIASVVGPLLGGVLTENVSWRWVFYLNLPIGGVSAGIILFTLEVPKSVQAEEVGWKEKILQMDLLGTFIIMGAATCFLLALQWAGVTKSWSDKDVVGTLVGFVVLFVIFCVLEWYLGERALLQGRLLKKRIIIVSSVYGTFLGGAFFSLVYYLPIYFQSISGVSPLASGTRNLGLIISISLFSIISGAAITVFGHYVPWMIGGSVLAAIGSGLLYTLGIGSTSSHWIGYQIVAGMGFGGGFQVPVIATQASVDVADISTASSIVLFFQTIGGAAFVSAAQSAFGNTLVSSVKTNVPQVSPAQVLAVGATQIRVSFAKEDILGIILSYLDGLHVVFALAIALSMISFFAAIFAPWPWGKINVGKVFQVPSNSSAEDPAKNESLA